MTGRRNGVTLGLCLLAIAAMIALDLGTKDWAYETLSEARPSASGVCETDSEGRLLGMQRRPTRVEVLIEDYLEYRYAENCGAAFGLMNNAQPVLRTVVFGGAAIAATVVLLGMFFQGRGSRFFALAVPCIVSGALGNFYDRVNLGYVVDFIHFHWRSEWSYPTFNVADVAISFGVGFLIIDQFLDWKRERAARNTES